MRLVRVPGITLHAEEAELSLWQEQERERECEQEREQERERASAFVAAEPGRNVTRLCSAGRVDLHLGSLPLTVGLLDPWTRRLGSDELLGSDFRSSPSLDSDSDLPDLIGLRRGLLDLDLRPGLLDPWTRRLTRRWSSAMLGIFFARA